MRDRYRSSRVKWLCNLIWLVACVAVYGSGVCLCAEKGEEPPEAEKGENSPEAEKGENSPEAEKAALVADWDFGLGGQEFNLSGNQDKFRQYRTPAQGVFLKELGGTLRRGRLAPAAEVSLWQVGEDDYNGAIRGFLSSGRSFGEFQIYRNRFFLEPGVQRLEESERSVRELTLKQFLRYPNLSLTFQHKSEELDAASQHEFFNYRNRLWDLSVQGKLGSGVMQLPYSDFRFFDRRLVVPNFTTRIWRLGYSLHPSPRYGVEAAFSRASIRQKGFAPNSSVEVLQLDAQGDLTSSLGLFLNLSRRRVNLKPTVNAFTREQRMGALSFSRQFKGCWGLRGGYQQTEVERINGDQTFVNTPKWRTVWLTFLGRPIQELKLTANGKIRHLSGQPQVITLDPRPLWIEDQRSFQIRLETAGLRRLYAYTQLSHMEFENDVRGVEFTVKSATFGGSWQATSKVQLFGDVTWEDWNGAGGFAVEPVFDTFLPNVRTTVVGFSYTIDPKTFLTASYTDFTTNNDNPLRLANGNVNGGSVTLA